MTNNGTIHIYDLTTKKETAVRSSAASHPAISGNTLVWHDESSGVLRLTMFDIKTRAKSHITKDVDNGSILLLFTAVGLYGVQIPVFIFSHIYGDKVIWSDFYIRLGNIRFYDISTKQQKEITTGDDMTGYDTGGSTYICSNKIVYLKHNDLENLVSGDLYVYDIDTGKSKQLTTGNTAQTPIISGNI